MVWMFLFSFVFCFALFVYLFGCLFVFLIKYFKINETVNVNIYIPIKYDDKVMGFEAKIRLVFCFFVFLLKTISMHKIEKNVIFDI